MKKFFLQMGVLASQLLLGAVSMSKVGEYAFAVDGCGGITYAGGNLFYVLRDHNDSTGHAEVYPLTLAIDSSSGAITSQTLGDYFQPGTNNDSEGLAYDPGRGTLWISDEATPTIKEFLTSGMAQRSAPVPALQKSKKRSNRSLEALTISGDGLTMWTANEQALTCDGDVSDGNTTVETKVRLMRMTRPTVSGEWTAAGEWAYACDKCGGSTSAQSGLSGLCALPDGSVLALEREVSVSTYGRCRIYRLTPEALNAAPDVASFSTLSNATVVTKGACLKEFKGSGLSSMIVYEGICLGPRLSDGSLSVVLVSDGGATKSALGGLITATTVSRLCALKLSGLDVKTLAFAEPAKGTAKYSGSNFRFLAGDTVENTLTGVELAQPPAAHAYTNRGEVASWETCGWSGSGQSGSGLSMTFNVTGDGTLAWNFTETATTNTTSLIWANDSFENYAVGTTPASMPGWTGDGTVVATTYEPAMPPGYPMARETHAQVFEVADEATRTYSSEEGNQRLEMMVCVLKAAEPLSEMTPEGDNQIAVAVDENGHLCAWSKYLEGGTWKTGWTQLSDKVWENGSWVRVEMLFDYTTNPDGVAFCQLRLDGRLCPTAHGVAAPNDLSSSGPWYASAKSVATRKVNELSLLGEIKVDDVLLTMESWNPERVDSRTTVILLR